MGSSNNGENILLHAQQRDSSLSPFLFGRLIMSRAKNNDEMMRFEHWPRMSNQRLPQRAHMFKGHEEQTPIVALAVVDESEFLSADADGSVRAWNATKGTELFRLDGFDNLKSLCLNQTMLITDGMEQFVCVHDFDVNAEDEAKQYDLDFL